MLLYFLLRLGITFSGDDPTGLGLVEKMAKSAAALSSLQTMVIREEGYEMPVGALREAAEALGAVRQARFFTPAGPRPSTGCDAGACFTVLRSTVPISRYCTRVLSPGRYSNM